MAIKIDREPMPVPLHIMKPSPVQLCSDELDQVLSSNFQYQVPGLSLTGAPFSTPSGTLFRSEPGVQIRLQGYGTQADSNPFVFIASTQLFKNEIAMYRRLKEHPRTALPCVPTMFAAGEAWVPTL